MSKFGFPRKQDSEVEIWVQEIYEGMPLRSTSVGKWGKQDWAEERNLSQSHRGAPGE